MNPDENKNDNSVNGSTPQIPGTEPSAPMPPVETPEPTGTTGFDATGDAPGDSLSTPPAGSMPEQPTAASDPSAGLPGSVMPPAPSEPVSTPTVTENPGVNPQDTPVMSTPTEPPKQEPSKVLVIVLVVVVVLAAAAAAAYFAGLFG